MVTILHKVDEKELTEEEVRYKRIDDSLEVYSSEQKNLSCYEKGERLLGIRRKIMNSAKAGDNNADVYTEMYNGLCDNLKSEMAHIRKEADIFEGLYLKPSQIEVNQAMDNIIARYIFERKKPNLVKRAKKGFRCITPQIIEESINFLERMGYDMRCYSGIYREDLKGISPKESPVANEETSYVYTYSDARKEEGALAGIIA